MLELIADLGWAVLIVWLIIGGLIAWLWHGFKKQMPKILD